MAGVAFVGSYAVALRDHVPAWEIALLRSGGRRLIRVADDGRGMDEADLALSVERHATSKIARLIKEDRSVYNLVQELTARIKQAR